MNSNFLSNIYFFFRISKNCPANLNSIFHPTIPSFPFCFENHKIIKFISIITGAQQNILALNFNSSNWEFIKFFNTLTHPPRHHKTTQQINWPNFWRNTTAADNTLTHSPKSICRNGGGQKRIYKIKIWQTGERGFGCIGQIARMKSKSVEAAGKGEMAHT